MAPINAFGTAFKIGAAAVAYVTNIDGPGLKRDALETTNMSSANGWRTRIPGLKDGEKVTLDIYYDPDAATHGTSAGGLLYSLVSASASTAMSIVFTDAAPVATWSFNGFVTGFKQKAPFDNLLSASVEVTIDGEVTLA